MTTVIYHSADYDGIFCREIAKHFLGEKDVQFIGWNFGDKELMAIQGDDGLGTVYVMDLPLDRPFGLDFNQFKRGENYKTFLGERTDVIWIDHHKSSIQTHPKNIPGYRIDGVAACRLAWQWFSKDHTDPVVQYNGLPPKQDFIDRKVDEPFSVRLVGEFDIWDKRHPWTDIFQYGLRAHSPQWQMFLQDPPTEESDAYLVDVVNKGEIAMEYAKNMDSMWLGEAGFVMVWEGIKFLCLNTVERGSLKFESKDVPETGHDALLAFGRREKIWTVSLYHAKHRTDLDLSQIAVKHGGGGHKGACGFTCSKLPFL